ncbi:PPOX class F420-dependent oxidoreductase [Actinomadura sp. NBRC 104425]|uniref:TIGR03668 family PPOX class F420-dependent oxidoreductase n=1 Tax=Actinomadura sp. NBRC 104425 TaxID=3032204 RepID=UPI0024A35FB8|nr:TIGR03668 family PPOX class F420-dependent oxidoreductase [Actinomadura sp. NBRC 104425]GLZ16173.1 PPOX class F420-dependent oxidoreductase [Actinomadura sp. NBRC 104425]
MPRLTQDAAWARLTSAPVARLATVDEHGRPHLVPVTFAVRRGVLYTAVDHKPKRSRDLRRLANIRANPHVSVLADHYDDDWERLWWVRADGHARVIEDDAQMAAPIALLRDRYAQYRDRPPEGPVIAVTIDAWSGWSASG